VKDIACDPLAVTAGWTVNHEASTAAGFAGQMLDAECHGGRPDLAIRLGDPTWRSGFGGQTWPPTLQPDPGSYPAVLGRRGHLPNRRPLAMAETSLRLNNA
jgi:hypothetical protein